MIKLAKLNATYQDDAKEWRSVKGGGGDFAVAFALAPKPRLYLLRIACTGSDETFAGEPKLLLGDIRTSLRVPVELGIVRLKRRGSSGRSKQ